MDPIKCFLLIVGLSALTACSGSDTGSSIGSDPADPAPNDSISGTVTFKGSPLAGAAVAVFDTNTNSLYQMTTTDSNGKYSFFGINTTR
ncbi:MAG: carboxypeptidase-like regulatory domain-containing protein [Candidatus Sulfotelmatobacter sp.]